MAESIQGAGAPGEYLTKLDATQRSVVNLVRESVNRSLDAELWNAEQSPSIICVESAPGSGKTTTMGASAAEAAALIPEGSRKKILVLAFGKRAKNDFAKQIKKMGCDEELFDIVTIHSLFFRHTRSFEGAKGDVGEFALDYAKSFFSKKMVRTALTSVVSGVTQFPEDVEDKLRHRRVLSGGIVTETNLTILHKMVNAYYSSPTNVKEVAKIEKTSDFFASGEGAGRSLADVELNEGDAATLRRIYPDKSIPLGEVLFRFMIDQIATLARTVTFVPREQAADEVFRHHTVIVEEYGADNRLVGSATTDRTGGDLVHVFKVPHNYYYKEFLRRSFTDPRFLNVVFGKYLGVLVDEAQDNDEIFFRVLLEAIRRHAITTCCAVGDSLQSIFAFRSPANFDILDAIRDMGPLLESKGGINVSEVKMNKTYRFGEHVANFVNVLYPNAGIKGLAKSGFVHDQALDASSMAEIVKRAVGRKGTTVGVVCRSNAECTRLYIQLRREGVGARLEGGIKQELKEFASKGIAAVTDERVRQKLVAVLSDELGEREHYSCDEVLGSNAARAILKGNGLSQLVGLSREDIENYIVPADHGRHRCVVTTAHQSKGAEYDYCVVGPDYFAKELGGGMSVEEFEDHVAPPGECSVLDIINLPQPGNEMHTPVTPEADLSTVLVPGKGVMEGIAAPEERNIFYVALTRAKEGVFFAEGPLFDVIKPALRAGSYGRCRDTAPWLLEDFSEVEVEVGARERGQPTLFSSAPGGGW